eukprot:204369-Alexandrium_andersonii.AAC.1
MSLTQTSLPRSNFKKAHRAGPPKRNVSWPALAAAGGSGATCRKARRNACAAGGALSTSCASNRAVSPVAIFRSTHPGSS